MCIQFLQKAKKSIRFYRNLQPNEDNDELIEMEFKKIKNGIEADKMDGNRFFPKWSDLMTKQSRKALTIGAVLMLVDEFSGCFAMSNYAANIFAESGSTLTPNMSAVVSCSIQTIGMFFALNLVNRVRRKVCILDILFSFRTNDSILFS